MIQIIIQIEEINQHVGVDILYKKGDTTTEMELLSSQLIFSRLNKNMSGLMGCEPITSTIAETSDPELNDQIVQSAKERLRRST